MVIPRFAWFYTYSLSETIVNGLLFILSPAKDILWSQLTIIKNFTFFSLSFFKYSFFSFLFNLTLPCQPQYKGTIKINVKKGRAERISIWFRNMWRKKRMKYFTRLSKKWMLGYSNNYFIISYYYVRTFCSLDLSAFETGKDVKWTVILFHSRLRCFSRLVLLSQQQNLCTVFTNIYHGAFVEFCGQVTHKDHAETFN
jgi:hypothetical protein